MQPQGSYQGSLRLGVHRGEIKRTSLKFNPLKKKGHSHNKLLPSSTY